MSLEEFEKSLRMDTREYPEATIRAYLTDLRKFESFLESRGKSLRDAGEEDVREFLYSIRDETKPSSRSRYLSAIRAYWRRVKKSPFPPSISKPRIYTEPPPWLSREEVDRLFEAARMDPKEGLRDEAMLRLAYDAALRVSELCSLRVSDLNLRESTVRVRGKGGRVRIIPISEDTVRLLKAWLASREEDSDYVFPGRSGGHISRHTFYAKLKSLADEASIEKRVYPHILRHSRATHLRLYEGMDIQLLQQFLGHRSITTTTIYSHVTLEALRRGLGGSSEAGGQSKKSGG